MNRIRFYFMKSARAAAARPRRSAAPAARSRERATAVPRRFRSAPPAQARSRETLERFAEAAERLLETRNFEEISVQEIVRKSGRPIGSFYARFGGKDALLPLLYQRYHDRLDSMVRSELGGTDWPALGLGATIDAVIDFFVTLYERERGLLRAITLFARMRPEALPADLVPQRQRVYESIFRVFDRHRSRIAHPDHEDAVRFGIFMVASVAREQILFGHAPQARITPMSRRALKRELARALHSYLTREAP